MLKGYEVRTYNCEKCGDFDVATDGYYGCSCGLYNGLRQGFEWGLSKSHEFESLGFPSPVYKSKVKSYEDFNFLTEEEKSVLLEIEQKCETIDTKHCVHGCALLSQVTMPDGRKEIHSFDISLEQFKTFTNAPSRTNKMCMIRDLTDKYCAYRPKLLADLKNFNELIDKIDKEDIDFFEQEDRLKEEFAWDNDYKEVIVDNYVFYPEAT
jgi:hypothetical protein